MLLVHCFVPYFAHSALSHVLPRKTPNEMHFCPDVVLAARYIATCILVRFLFCLPPPCSRSLEQRGRRSYIFPVADCCANDIYAYFLLCPLLPWPFPQFPQTMWRVFMSRHSPVARYVAICVLVCFLIGLPPPCSPRSLKAFLCIVLVNGILVRFLIGLRAPCFSRSP